MNVNERPLSFNKGDEQVSSFSTLEEARKAAIGREGNEVIVETTEFGVFDYKGTSTYTVHDVENLKPEQVKDGLKVNGLQKGINAIELVFDEKSDGKKTNDKIFSIKNETLDLQKNVGNVYAFNTSELGKGTVRIVKNDDSAFAFAFQVKDLPDIAEFGSVKEGVKNYLLSFIEENNFADGDEEDEALLKEQLRHYVTIAVERGFTSDKFPEIIVSVNKDENGQNNMSVITDWPIAGFTEKDLNKLNITTNKDGQTVIPFGKVKISTDLGKSDKPELAFELLSKSYKPIDVPLRLVDNQYTTDEKTLESKTESAFTKLSTDQTVDVGAGVTWLGNEDPELTITAGIKHDFKDYAAVKFNVGGHVDVMPQSGRFQVTPTLGANVTALEYFGVPLSVNVDVGPSLGNMSSTKDFSFGIKTGVGVKLNITDNIDVGVNYGHVFGIVGESQDTVTATLGIKF